VADDSLADSSASILCGRQPRGTRANLLTDLPTDVPDFSFASTSLSRLASRLNTRRNTHAESAWAEASTAAAARSHHVFLNPLLCRLKSDGMGIRRRREPLQERHDDTGMATRIVFWLPNLDPG
jgi:hypothetical protein